jgi:dipeptidyl aminopeptidase/acylaminoacyl peptidase
MNWPRCGFLVLARAMTLMLGAAMWPAAAAPASDAAPSVPLSVKDAMKWASVEGLKISPDGKHVAGVIQLREAKGVIVYDTATLVPRLLRSESPTLAGAWEVTWFNDRLLAVQSSTRGADVVDLESVAFLNAGSRYLNRIDNDKAGHARFLYQTSDKNTYRYDVVTKKSVAVDRPIPGGSVVAWIYDHQGEARVVTTRDTAFFSDDTRVTHWYRESPDHPWEKLANFAYLDDVWEPVAFSRDDTALIVSSRQGRDTYAYFRYDLKLRQLGEMMAGHPTQDIYAEFDAPNMDAQYVITNGIKTEIKWFDAKGEAIQRGVDLALPDRINLLQGNPQKQMLVFSHSDKDPGRWFVLDVATGTLRLVTSRKPEIDIDKMRPKQIVAYKARDGLTIPAYLTSPMAAGAGPAVVFIHGGPQVRDDWSWDPEVQMLASRGYTVFQPQFRGSGGFGKRYMEAGYGQWGAAMQDDITDGVQWLVERGYADPSRICIYGASYGGYAALWGLAKTSGLYRCGASFAGVSDLQYMLRDGSDVNSRATGRLYRNQMFGTSAARKQVLDDVSPLKNAAQFRAPVLIAHGDWDRRVPITHSERMVDALKYRSKEVQWMVLREEGHGIFYEENQERFFQALFNLFDRTIGRPAPAAQQTR